jgi:hypothetical protein
MSSLWADFHALQYYEHQKHPYCEKCIHIINPQTKIQAHASNKGFAF